MWQNAPIQKTFIKGLRVLVKKIFFESYENSSFPRKKVGIEIDYIYQH